MVQPTRRARNAMPSLLCMLLRRPLAAEKEVFLSAGVPASNSFVSPRPAILVGLALAGLPSVAHAERVVEATVSDAPFTPAELTAALRVRLPIAGPPIVIAVTTA